MYKFYEYSDEAQEEVDRLIEIAEGKETVVVRDTTIYANNNKDKPFSMDGFTERLGKPVASSPEIEKQKEQIKEPVEECGIDDNTYKMIDEVNKKYARNKK